MSLIHLFTNGPNTIYKLVEFTPQLEQLVLISGLPQQKLHIHLTCHTKWYPCNLHGLAIDHIAQNIFVHYLSGPLPRFDTQCAILIYYFLRFIQAIVGCTIKVVLILRRVKPKAFFLRREAGEPDVPCLGHYRIEMSGS